MELQQKHKKMYKPQSELDWKKQRIGYFTGSQISELMNSGKKGEMFGRTAMSYIYEIAGQRNIIPSYLTDDYLFSIYDEQVSIETKAMRFGKDNEGFAVEEYEKQTGNITETIGSVRHPYIKYFSSSPDRIATTPKAICKVVEVKCPSIKNFIEYMSEVEDNETLKAVNPKYFYQVQAEMSCTALDKADFVVFCPFLKHNIHIVEITRDEAVIAEFEKRITAANEIINQILNKK